MLSLRLWEEPPRRHENNVLQVGQGVESFLRAVWSFIGRKRKSLMLCQAWDYYELSISCSLTSWSLTHRFVLVMGYGYHYTLCWRIPNHRLPRLQRSVSRVHREQLTKELFISLILTDYCMGYRKSKKGASCPL